MSGKKAIGGSLGAILVLIISQVVAQLSASVLVFTKAPDGICNIAAGILYLLLAYFLLKLFAEKLLKIDLGSLGIPRFHIKAKWIVVAIALPVIIVAIYLLMPGKFISSDMDEIQVFSTLSAGIAFTGIAAGFVEEMVFRGFILNLLKTRWNRRVAIILPSVLFGAVHIIGMDFSVSSCLLVLAAGTMVGIMFSLIALESGSIWNGGIVHCLWNIIIIGGGLTVSEAADPYAVMTYVLDTKNFAITGGEFGIESSVIAVLGYGLVALLAARSCHLTGNGKSENLS